VTSRFDTTMPTGVRCGDTVFHRPTGETWLVAYVDGERLAWAGWPEGYAHVGDCLLVEKASDAEHRAAVDEWLRPGVPSDHRRGVIARLYAHRRAA